jgi:hypothetical protein
VDRGLPLLALWPMTARKKKTRSPTSRVADSVPVIDLAKLRDVLRTIGDEYVFYMLDEAIDLLPPDKLAKLVGPYIQLERLRPDAGALATRSWLEDVKAFDTTSRASSAMIRRTLRSAFQRIRLGATGRIGACGTPARARMWSAA